MGTEPRISHLDWDTEFWGKPTARVTLQGDCPPGPADVRQAIEQAQSQYDFVQVLVPVEQIANVQAVEATGCFLVDARCEVVLEHPVVERTGSSNTIRAARPEELPAIAELAATLHGNSRFGADPFLPVSRVNHLYRRWIQRDAELPDWQVGVASGPRGAPHGYVTFGPAQDHTGTIGLIGVAPHARNQRLGSHLLTYAVATLFNTGSRRAAVVTQAGSRTAMSMYQAHGFVVSDVSLWFHWHRDSWSSR